MSVLRWHGSMANPHHLRDPARMLRSVLLICCAVSRAFMCRVSTQITGSSAAVNALTSHCDSGPASIPIRPKLTPSEVRRAMISDGSVGTFCSKITLPASSTTHTDVSFTDTSRPTKCAISSLLPRCSRSPDLDPLIATEGDARSASKAEPQPPRYTILRGQAVWKRPEISVLVIPPWANLL